MTMFYSDRDVRLIEEARLRRLIDEELDARREPSAPVGFLHTMDGDLVSVDHAMDFTKGRADV